MRTTLAAAVRAQRIAARSHQWATEPVVDLPAVRVWHQMVSASECAAARSAYADAERGQGDG